MTNDHEVNRKIVKLAKSSVDLAMKLFGEKTFITNQTMLTYALALSKCPDMLEASVNQFEKAKKLVKVVNNEISF